MEPLNKTNMLKIEESVLKAIIGHALEDTLVEACGYLAAGDGIVRRHYRLANLDRASDHFSMDPREQFDIIRRMREDGLGPVAVYHSHPATPARPSVEDIRLAHDPGISYVIISLAAREPVVKSFRIVEERVTPEEIFIVRAEDEEVTE